MFGLYPIGSGSTIPPCLSPLCPCFADLYPPLPTHFVGIGVLVLGMGVPIQFLPPNFLLDNYTLRGYFAPYLCLPNWVCRVEKVFPFLFHLWVENKILAWDFS